MLRHNPYPNQSSLRGGRSLLGPRSQFFERPHRRYAELHAVEQARATTPSQVTDFELPPDDSLLRLLHPFHHPSQRVLIHRGDRSPTHLLHQRGHGTVVERQPLALRRHEHIAQPDLLCRNLQLRAAIRPLALFDQPRLVKQEEGSPHHHCALAQLFCNRRRRMHRIWRSRQYRQNPHAQSKSSALCHAQKATTAGPLRTS
jgi:hypothetical protein